MPQSIKADILKDIPNLITWAQATEQLGFVLHSPDFLLLWNGFILNILVWSEIKVDFYTPLDSFVSNVVGKKTQLPGVVKKLLMAYATYLSFQERGWLYGWNFENTNDLCIQCIQGLMFFVKGDLDKANKLLKEFHQKYYQEVSTTRGPFIACEFCEDRCLYRFDLLAIVQETAFRSEWLDAIRIHKTPKSLWEDLALINQERVNNFLVNVPPPITKGLSVCLAAQMTHSFQFSLASQTNIVHGIHDAITVPRERRAMSDQPEPPLKLPEKDEKVEDIRRSRLETQEKSSEPRRLSSEEREFHRIQSEVKEDFMNNQTALAEAQLCTIRRSELLQHRNGGSVLEEIDTYLDERRATNIAEREYPNKHIRDLPDRNLKGVVYEGMTARHLEALHGVEKVGNHPEDLHLKDGRPIEPDFAVQDDQGHVVELVDSKAYTRKGTQNPEATASSLTHMQNLEKASRYTDADIPDLKQVTFVMPEETSQMSNVQEGVAQLGNEKVVVEVKAVGSEAQIKQNMEDLRTPTGDRYLPSEQTFQEIQRIQSLSIEQRRDAVSTLVKSLRDEKGDPISEFRNLSRYTRVERNGDGITFINPREEGKEYTIWYK